MSFERFSSTSSHESMSFQELEKDEVAGPILQKKALEYLKEHDTEYFERDFTGNLDEEGYLVKKDGQTSSTKPSMNIGGGEAMERVVEMTKEELREKNA